MPSWLPADQARVTPQFPPARPELVEEQCGNRARFTEKFLTKKVRFVAMKGGPETHG